MIARPPRLQSVPLAALVLAIAGGVACVDEPRSATAHPWPEADALFLGDPIWLGSDGGYSIDLGGDRVLWLFGDTLLARDAARDRTRAAFVRNTIALQEGYDPGRARIAFYYRATPDLGSWLPEEGDHWFWPGGGARVGGKVVTFWQELRQDAPGQWGFEGVGAGVRVIENPDDEPARWRVTTPTLPTMPYDVTLGTAVMLDDGRLYAFGDCSSLHDLCLARISVADAENGDFGRLAFWDGASYTATPAARVPAIPTFAPEGSIHHDRARGAYFAVETVGHGAGAIGLREAKAPEGPWSDPRTIHWPIEAREDPSFVYAAKGHPELRGADLVVTYATNWFEDDGHQHADEQYFPLASALRRLARDRLARVRRRRVARDDARVRQRAGGARVRLRGARSGARRRRAVRRERQRVLARHRPARLGGPADAPDSADH